MAKRHKRRLFAGAVCTQIVYNVSEQADIKSSKPRKPRFQTQAERDEFNSKISAGKFAALINANFGPTSLYSTLTLSAEFEVHTAEEIKRIRAIRYTADFSYRFGGKLVVEDVKSTATRTKEYLRNKKMMRSKYGIDIQEV